MKIGRGILHLLPLLCGCLALMVHTPAQAQVPLSLENFSERLSRDVPVSGRMLVGAFVMPGETVEAPRSLASKLLWRGAAVESTREPLCVTLASRDGQYYGEGKLSAATLDGLTGPVRVKGKHKESTEEYLLRLTKDELAVLASSGDCRLGTADGNTTVYLLDRSDTGAPARQGGAPREFNLVLMLNSMTYTLEVEVVLPGSATRQATCRTPDSAERNKAFNTICELTVPNAATKAELVIKRRRYERGFDPIRFNLVWSRL